MSTPLTQNTTALQELLARINSLPAETDLTPIVEALTEKGQTVPDGATADVLASLIAAIEDGGGIETKSFTVADRTANFIVETLSDVPTIVAWYDAEWSNSEDTEVDRYKPFLGIMMKEYGGSIMQAVAIYKSSSAGKYSASTVGNKTTVSFNSGGTTSFATDALTVKKGNRLVAATLGNYGFRAGQTINYVVIM